MVPKEFLFHILVIIIIIIAYTCSYCKPVIVVTGFKASISHIFNITTDIVIGEILTLTCCYHQGFPGPPGPAGVPGVEGPQGDNVS